MKPKIIIKMNSQICYFFYMTIEDFLRLGGDPISLIEGQKYVWLGWDDYGNNDSYRSFYFNQIKMKLYDIK